MLVGCWVLSSCGFRFVFCCVLSVVCCLLCCVLHVVSCMLFVVLLLCSCLLCRCSLCRCVLFVVRCSSLVVVCCLVVRFYWCESCEDCGVRCWLSVVVGCGWLLLVAVRWYLLQVAVSAVVACVVCCILVND